MKNKENKLQNRFPNFEWSVLCIILGDLILCRWQTKLDRVAIVTGVTGNLCLAFLFYPVTRGSSILPMLGLTSESSIKYHNWLGRMAMALFSLHGFLYIVYWIITDRLTEGNYFFLSQIFQMKNFRFLKFNCYAPQYIKLPTWFVATPIFPHLLLQASCWWLRFSRCYFE